jgi:RimJ/RimL family protein N-acetyltransferase
VSISIIPLDLSQLRALAVDGSHVDGVPVATGALPPLFILQTAIGALQDGKSAIWSSPFAFIDDRLGQIVGTGGFKGYPTDGRVEIGYGIAAPFRRNGFATSAVRDLIRVAFSAPGVVEIYAETAADNPASRRVVEKTGFRHLGQRASESDGTVDRWLQSKCA